jgi:hypothetical protein
MQLILGALTPGVKWPVCEADHYLLSSAMVKNVSIPPLPQYVTWCGIKARSVCECVCVCVRERERERNRVAFNIENKTMAELVSFTFFFFFFKKNCFSI